MKKYMVIVLMLVMVLGATPAYAWDEDGTHITLAQKDPVAKELLYGPKGNQCQACHKEGGMAHVLPPTVTEVVYGRPAQPAKATKKVQVRKAQVTTKKPVVKEVQKTDPKNCPSCHPTINMCGRCHSIDWN